MKRYITFYIDDNKDMIANHYKIGRWSNSYIISDGYKYYTGEIDSNNIVDYRSINSHIMEDFKNVNHNIISVGYFEVSNKKVLSKYLINNSNATIKIVKNRDSDNNKFVDYECDLNLKEFIDNKTLLRDSKLKGLV